MACLHCSHPKTIKAHLIPRAFATQVQTGKSHAVVKPTGVYRTTQSGIWDPEILCENCDGVLGTYENYALQVSNAIRKHGSDKPFATKVVDGANVDTILRFAAGILYKYSLTHRSNGKIDLGRYQAVLEQFVFDSEESVPCGLDAILFRPIRFCNDDAVCVYGAPKQDRQAGVNIYRMMLGGLIYFVKLDKRDFNDDTMRRLAVSGKTGLIYCTTPTDRWEEFSIPRNQIATSERLSTYLERQEEGG
ncbi:hypothetical protein CA13_19990 [Planctomycetes bacterium CA13]|uniref:HNH endonuclease 5 domain-containing protein n=1 Tax=Novipirellula herctigrandis TaxID=2527986 RepID=A0A5C5YZT8_9BACT|nr:hypothetical protein CA13_19990 [Planctomycetes bacterium CA13]